METVGIALAVVGAVSNVLGLVDLPQQGRRWAAVLGRLHGEAGRWAFVVGGLILQASAAFFGTPTAVTFGILLSGVFLAATIRFYQARQGLPNWQACHEWPDPIQGESVVSLAVRSLDGDVRAISGCRVIGPSGGPARNEAEIDDSNNIFGVVPSGTDRYQAAFQVLGSETHQSVSGMAGTAWRGGLTREWVAFSFGATVSACAADE